jgi:GINS complex subunit 2
MDPTEYEFLAENEKIVILPKIQHPTLTLIQGDFGPFRPGITIEVPLWLAVMLRKSDKCEIETPGWMDLERLEECREEEKESSFFTPLPANHIFEISNILLDVTAASISNADQIRSILKEIFDIRQSKLRKSIEILFKEEYLYAKVNHLQEIELANFRPVFPQAFDYLQRLNEATGAAKRKSSHSMSFSMNNSTFS